jgi:hypothetical protein
MAKCKRQRARAEYILTINEQEACVVREALDRIMKDTTPGCGQHEIASQTWQALDSQYLRAPRDIRNIGDDSP